MSTIKKLLDPKNDFIFQRLFGNQKHKNILLSFLNAILKLDEKNKLTNIEIIDNTKLEKEREQDKLGILDVLANTQDGTQIIKCSKKQ